MNRYAFHPPILAILFCEFHFIQGPKIALAVSSGSNGAPDLTGLDEDTSTEPTESLNPEQG
jgi:hypothetical protein